MQKRQFPNQPVPLRVERDFILILLLMWAVSLLAGCSHAPAPTARPTLFFPPPPEQPRVQFLGSISSPKDLPQRQSSFADFVLGEEQVHYPLAKPINATLIGSKIYTCDTVLNRVLVYDMATGETGVLKGDEANGKIQQPNNIATDEQGRIYIADKVRGAVLVYAPDESFLYAWGRPNEIGPVDMKVGAKYLYVCDAKNHRIELWDKTDGKLVRQIGGMGTGRGEFYYPSYLALDASGSLYVTDTLNFRIQQFSPEGEFIQAFGELGSTIKSSGSFGRPKGLDVDAKGRVYIADAIFCNVQIFNSRHQLLMAFGGPNPERGNLDLPAGLRVFPWPADNPWLAARIAPGFDPEFLVLVVSQKGAGYLNFYAVARAE